MEGMKRIREWRETIPGIEGEKIKHEFSGLISNIIKEFGAFNVIDYGCGDGSLCKTFSKDTYLGLDIDEKVLEVAKSTFSGYSFQKPGEDVYSTDMCIASKVFNQLNEETIHGILKKMRCKWFLLAEPLTQAEVESNIYPFYTRNRQDYIKLMRAHDLLLVKHMVKTIDKEIPEDMSFLIFRKAGRNPNSK